MTLARELRAAKDAIRTRLIEQAILRETLELLEASIDKALAVIEQPANPPSPVEAAGVVRSPASPASIQAEAVRVARTPADQAGDAGSSPALRSTPIARTCPVCEFVAPSINGLAIHRGRMGHKGPPAPAKAAPTTGGELLREHDEPAERPWPRRPTIAERVAARDAGRAGKRYPNGRGGGSLGE